MNKECIGCRVVFYKTKNTRGVKWTSKKYCTHKCYMKHRTSWNLGKTKKEDPRIAQPWLGKRRLDMENESNPSWKGKDAGYYALHEWVKQRLGKAKKCSFDENHLSSRYVWSNLSGEYKRDLSDWRELCNKCNLNDGVKVSYRFGPRRNYYVN